MTQFNKLVIFDCDGTLVDSQHLIVAAIHETFDREKLPRVSDAAVRSIVGLSLEDAVGALLPALDAQSHIRLANEYRKNYYRLRVELASGPDPLYDGTRAVLEGLSAEGYLLGVATGNSKRGLDRILKEHGLEDLFVTLQTADGHPSKPHPSMIEAAIAEAGSSAALTVMVGDTSYDMAMSARAGCHGLGVLWGYHNHDELVKAGARQLVQSFHEVPAFIRAWLG